MTELSAKRRQGILLICCLSLFIVGLDNTIVNVALPSIGSSLHATTSGLQWTIDAYTLVLASLLVLSGSTADRLGRKRIFQLGLVLFTLGSLLCSVAPNLGTLVAFRAVQAIGGSMLNPVAMSIITNTFTDPRERARAIGVWGGVVGVSMALGPIVGGVLVEAVDWRAIFWINIPVGAVAWLLTRAYVPESKAPHARRIDPGGQVLVMVGLATLVGAIIEGPRHGWGSPLIVALFVVAAAAFVRSWRGSCGAPSRSSTCGSSAPPPSPARPSSRSAPSRRCRACCSSTRSTCRRSAATARSRPGCARSPSPGSP